MLLKWLLIVLGLMKQEKVRERWQWQELRQHQELVPITTCRLFWILTLLFINLIAQSWIGHLLVNFKNISTFALFVISVSKCYAEVVCLGMSFIQFIQSHGTIWSEIFHSMVVTFLIKVRIPNPFKLWPSTLVRSSIPTPVINILLIEKVVPLVSYFVNLGILWIRILFD